MTEPLLHAQAWTPLSRRWSPSVTTGTAGEQALVPTIHVPPAWVRGGSSEGWAARRRPLRSSAQRAQHGSSTEEREAPPSLSWPAHCRKCCLGVAGPRMAPAPQPPCPSGRPPPLHPEVSQDCAAAPPPAGPQRVHPGRDQQCAPLDLPAVPPAALSGGAEGGSHARGGGGGCGRGQGSRARGGGG